MDALNKDFCPICLKPLKGEYETHHIHPINLGGDEDVPPYKLVNLCSNCHAAIHKTASLLMSKHKKRYNHSFNNDDELERAKPYIQAILNARNWFESQPQSNKPRRRMIVLDISDADWVKLHKAKIDNGFSNMKDFLLSVIQCEIKKVG